VATSIDPSANGAYSLRAASKHGDVVGFRELIDASPALASTKSHGVAGGLRAAFRCESSRQFDGRANVVRPQAQCIGSARPSFEVVA
jgi:hypothetical protein